MENKSLIVVESNSSKIEKDNVFSKEDFVLPKTYREQVEWSLQLHGIDIPKPSKEIQEFCDKFWKENEDEFLKIMQEYLRLTYQFGPYMAVSIMKAEHERKNNKI
jgi:hypothetical protein